MPWHVVPWHEFVDACLWPTVDEARQQVGEVCEWIDFVQLACLYQRGEPGPVLSAFILQSSTGSSLNMESGEAFLTTIASLRRQAMRNTLQPVLGFKSPRQLTMVLDSLRMARISIAERNAVISRLAGMLAEAAGIESEEGGDDGR